MGKAGPSTIEAELLSHNLLGQRLGRKGRDTRERILAATEKLLAGGPDTTISLSAVAREASLGMTTLYLYFTDLTELLLAVLDPVTASAEASHIGDLRTPWPDQSLNAHCLKFVDGYYDFWLRHSRVLHLRNSLADNGDERMRRHRIALTEPVIKLLVQQMDANPAEAGSYAYALATVLITGVERTITHVTDVTLLSAHTADPGFKLQASARLLELGIRECRALPRAAS